MNQVSIFIRKLCSGLTSSSKVLLENRGVGQFLFELEIMRLSKLESISGN